MTLLAPVITYRDDKTLASLSSVTLSGSGPLGAVPVGSASNVVSFRIYNNYANASNIANAVNCTLAAYDNTSIQYSQATVPVTSAWLQVRWYNVDGNTTNQDGQFYAIGGSQKHSCPINSSTIGGSGPHYAVVQLQVVVPATAIGGTMNQGLWLECNYNL